MFVDDTDILVFFSTIRLFLTSVKAFFMSSGKLSKSSGQHITYRIQDVEEKRL